MGRFNSESCKLIKRFKQSIFITLLLALPLSSCDDQEGDISVTVDSGPKTKKIDLLIPKRYLKKTRIYDGAVVKHLSIAIDDEIVLGEINAAVQSTGLEASEYPEIIARISSGDTALAKQSWSSSQKTMRLVFDEEIEGFKVCRRQQRAGEQTFPRRYLIPTDDYNDVSHLWCWEEGMGNPDFVMCDTTMAVKNRMHLNFFIRQRDLAALPEISSILQRISKTFFENK